MASSYRAWLAPLGTDLDVRPVQLPGRENRRSEPFAVDMGDLVAELTDAVVATDAEDIALFGHSMGATIATRLCASLEQRGRKVRALFVSGHRGPARGDDSSEPELARRMGALADESDEGLWDVLHQLGAVPDTVRYNEELHALFVPILRADHRLARGEQLGSERIQAPITVLAGTADRLLIGVDLSGWSTLTSGDCEERLFPGGHFYLAEQRDAVADVVRRRLGQLTGADVTEPRGGIPG